MADWSWDVEVPASLERLFLCLLEDYSADTGWVPFKFVDLQNLTGMSQQRIKQAANTLWKLGRLEYQPSRGGQPQRWHIIKAATSTPSPPQTPPFPRVGFSFGKTGAEGTTHSTSQPAATEHRELAVSLVKHWFATTTPRPTPAGGFPAAVKIVEKMLDAGWDRDQLESALRDVPTLSTASMEFALRRRKPQPSYAAPQGSTVPPVKPYEPEEQATPEERAKAKAIMEKIRNRQFFGGDVDELV